MPVISIGWRQVSLSVPFQPFFSSLLFPVVALFLKTSASTQTASKRGFRVRCRAAFPCRPSPCFVACARIASSGTFYRRPFPSGFTAEVSLLHRSRRGGDECQEVPQTDKNRSIGICSFSFFCNLRPITKLQVARREEENFHVFDAYSDIRSLPRHATIPFWPASDSKE